MFEKRSDLIKFLTVAETGTVLGAADRIAMTQPALSRAIARLETDLGGKLFERFPTGVRLTEFGDLVAEQARHILREIEAAESRLEAALSRRMSKLRVTVGPVWMLAVLPAVVARFHERFPDIELKVQTMTFAEGLRLLVDGESDLHCGRIDTDSNLPGFLRREVFLDSTSAIVARSDHPLQKSRVAYEDLANWPWIDCEAAVRTRDANGQSPVSAVLDDLFAKTSKRVRTIVRTGSAGLLMLGTGRYLSRLSLTHLDSLPSLRLKPLPTEFGRSHQRDGIVSRRSAWDFDAVRHFAEIVRETARSHRVSAPAPSAA